MGRWLDKSKHRKKKEGHIKREIPWDTGIVTPSPSQLFSCLSAGTDQNQAPQGRQWDLVSQPAGHTAFSQRLAKRKNESLHEADKWPAFHQGMRVCKDIKTRTQKRQSPFRTWIQMNHSLATAPSFPLSSPAAVGLKWVALSWCSNILALALTCTHCSD